MGLGRWFVLAKFVLLGDPPMILQSVQRIDYADCRSIVHPFASRTQTLQQVVPHDCSHRRITCKSSCGLGSYLGPDLVFHRFSLDGEEEGVSEGVRTAEANVACRCYRCSPPFPGLVFRAKHLSENTTLA